MLYAIVLCTIDRKSRYLWNKGLSICEINVEAGIAAVWWNQMCSQNVASRQVHILINHQSSWETEILSISQILLNKLIYDQYIMESLRRLKNYRDLMNHNYWVSYECRWRPGGKLFWEWCCQCQSRCFRNCSRDGFQSFSDSRNWESEIFGRLIMYKIWHTAPISHTCSVYMRTTEMYRLNLGLPGSV